MKPRHQVSRDALELVKRFEGYRRASAQLPDGRWTIGYGHTRSARAGVEISEADAEALLLYDLVEVGAAVDRLCFTPLTQNQFDAVVSFAFNIGIENFRVSTVLRRINEGAMLQAAYALEMWRKADIEGETIVVDALIRRRAAEKALFLRPADGYVPAPSPVVQPRVDYEAVLAQPRQTPLNIIAPLDGELAEAHAEGAAEEGEDGVSSAEAAVDALAARLQALIPDIEGEAVPPEALAPLDVPPPEPEAGEPEPGEPDAGEAASELAIPENGAAAEADPELPQARAEALPGRPVLYAPDAVVEAEPAVSPAEEPSAGEFHVEPISPKRRKHRRSAKLSPYAPLLALGLIVFLGGVAWGVSQMTPAGLGVALLGVLMMAVSLYNLLGQIDQNGPGR